MRALSRRTVHGMLVGAAVLPLAGCDLDDLLPEAGPSTPPAPSADELLVDDVVTAIRAARGVAASVTGAEPLVAVHDAHLRALRAAVPATSATPSTPSTAAPPAPPAASGAAGLRASEQALERALTDAALRAEAGGLARMLAAMAAAVAQQLVVLPSRRIAS